MNPTPAPPSEKPAARTSNVARGPWPAPDGSAQAADEEVGAAHADLLLVDDDAELRGEMAAYLADAGYPVHQAGDARSARAILASQTIRLIVLDVMMPGEDGLTFCRKLRQQSSGPPILMLSAQGESTDRVVGLELGADDYAVKPLPPRELLARVRALLRRQSAAATMRGVSAVYAFAGFRLNLARRQLKAPNGMVLQLTPAELSILSVFMRFPGRVLSREALLREARGEDAEVLDRAVDIQISRLRRKLHAQSDRELITTARGAGYMLDARVSAL